MVLRAVIFDFNGVLLDDEDVHFRAYRRLFSEEGLRLDEAEYYERFLGLNDRGVIERAFGLDVDAEEMLARKASLYAGELGDALPFFAGAVDLVRQTAAAMPIAIASGARRTEIEHTLERAGIRPCFRALVTADEVHRGKPAPDVYLRALAALGMPAGECLVLEDAPNGIVAARAAEIPCVGIAHSQSGENLAQADAVVDRIELLDLEELRRHHAAITAGR